MGFLITVEGGEYTGKTKVVVPGITRVFKSLGVKTLISREPGGTRKAENIRKLIFKRKEEGASSYELAKLFFKARKVHLDEVIIPFLGKSKEKDGIAILDRYLDSTRVYQGLEGGVPLSKIFELESEYIDNYLPDLTLILYVARSRFREVLEGRAKREQKCNRTQTYWDKESVSSHLKRQQRYLTLPRLSHKRGESRLFSQIDVSKSPNEVVFDCIKACAKILFNPNPTVSMNVKHEKNLIAKSRKIIFKAL